MKQETNKPYKFEKLQVWQISLELSDVIYEIIRRISLHSIIEIIACLRLIERRKYRRPKDPIIIKANEVTNQEFVKLSAFIKSLK